MHFGGQRIQHYSTLFNIFNIFNMSLERSSFCLPTPQPTQQMALLTHIKFLHYCCEKAGTRRSKGGWRGGWDGAGGGTVTTYPVPALNPTLILPKQRPSPCLHHHWSCQAPSPKKTRHMCKETFHQIKKPNNHPHPDSSPPILPNMGLCIA